MGCVNSKATTEPALPAPPPQTSQPAATQKRSMAPTLLHISASPMGQQSSSRAIAAAFVEAWKAKNPDGKVVDRDLAASPVPILDAEAIFAGYTPEDQRAPSAKAKHQLRLDLINEIISADEILVSTPKHNWNVPGNLKAYIDQIVVPGTLDGDGTNKLAGKKVTIAVSMGGGSSEHGDTSRDFVAQYLKMVFGRLGSTDVEAVSAQWGLAGVVPALAAFVDKKAEELAAAKEWAKKRAAA